MLYEDINVNITLIWVSIALQMEDIEEQELKRLENDGQPVIRIRIPDESSLGGEWLRWKMALDIMEMVLDEETVGQSSIAYSLSV